MTDNIENYAKRTVVAGGGSAYNSTYIKWVPLDGYQFAHWGYIDVREVIYFPEYDEWQLTTGSHICLITDAEAQELMVQKVTTVIDHDDKIKYDTKIEA